MRGLATPAKIERVSAVLRHPILGIVGGHDVRDSFSAAVVKLGSCSGVLVQSDTVLTSGHCLDGPIEEVVVAGERVRVTQCERHPRYEAGRVQDDIGYRRLASSRAGVPIALDDVVVATATPVSMAGYGQGDALGRLPAALRVVETEATWTPAGVLQAGTPTATACRGDSGGPVVVQRAGELRLTGIIHGTEGVICGSPAEIVSIGAAGPWLSNVLAPAPTPKRLVSSRRWDAAAGASLVLAAILLGIVRLRRRKFRPDG
jgi:hypothetical protein